jgi:hypothetical protein
VGVVGSAGCRRTRLDGLALLAAAVILVCVWGVRGGERLKLGRGVEMYDAGGRRYGKGEEVGSDACP